MKKLGLVITLLLILSLTGCIHEYQLSDENTEVAAEYMAGLLLEYDENYQSSLIKQEELEENTMGLSVEEGNSAVPTPTSTPTPVPTNEEGGSQAAGDENTLIDGEFTIAEVIGATNFDIQYDNYKLYNSYPEDATSTYFSLTPNEGKQLLVATFLIGNTTDKKRKIDLNKSKIVYQLDINVGSIYKPSLALLENDLQFIVMTVEPKKKETALLIFEVPKDVEMKNINLIISKDS
ncbi:MAG TPA: hypothetical protein VJ888_09160, partial [Mobilitalea sp.]|nr:hypothetical protein [Mobilitalea sp.]